MTILPDCITETERTARKQHDCVVCRRHIEPRSRYMDVSGIWEGDPQRFRFHLRCFRVYCAMQDESGGELGYEQTREALWERMLGRNPWRPINR